MIFLRIVNSVPGKSYLKKKTISFYYLNHLFEYSKEQLTFAGDIKFSLFLPFEQDQKGKRVLCSVRKTVVNQLAKN